MCDTSIETTVAQATLKSMNESENEVINNPGAIPAGTTNSSNHNNQANSKVDASRDGINLGDVETLIKEAIAQTLSKLKLNSSTIEQNKILPSVVHDNQLNNIPSIKSQILDSSHISLLPMFHWNPKDSGEAERFVNSLSEMAQACGWSDSQTKRVLESRLSFAAKQVYWEGLGDNTQLTISERLGEFTRLFTRKPSEDESLIIFLHCYQERDETIIQYKHRLIKVANPLRVSLADSPLAYNRFIIRQFKRGLCQKVRIEVLKSTFETFDELVDYAAKVEDCIKICDDKTVTVATMGSYMDRLDDLENSLANLTDTLTQLLSKRDEQQTRTCNNCGKIGHDTKYCRKSKSNKTSLPPCNHCNYTNHLTKNCYYRPKSNSPYSPEVQNTRIDHSKKSEGGQSKIESSNDKITTSENTREKVNTNGDSEKLAKSKPRENPEVMSEHAQSSTKSSSKSGHTQQKSNSQTHVKTLNQSNKSGITLPKTGSSFQNRNMYDLLHDENSVPTNRKPTNKGADFKTSVDKTRFAKLVGKPYDRLSPFERIKVQEAIKKHSIKEIQHDDPESKTIINNVINNVYKNKEYVLDHNSILLIRMTEYYSQIWDYRVFVPAKAGRKIILDYHVPNRSGILPRVHEVGNLCHIFRWTNMSEEISQYIKQFELLQKKCDVKLKTDVNPKNPKNIPKVEIKTQVKSKKEVEQKGRAAKNRKRSPENQSERIDKNSVFNDKRKILVDEFFQGVQESQNTRRPQVILKIINKYENKPLVKIEMFGRPIIALVDSGAEMTVVNERFLRDYDPTRGYVRSSLCSPVTGTSVSAYYTEVPITMGGVKFFFTTCIAPMDDADIFQMLIGYDLLQAHEAVLDTANNKIRLAINKGHRSPPNRRANAECNYISKNVEHAEFLEILDLINMDETKLNTEQNKEFKTLIKTYQNIILEDVAKMQGANVPPYEPVFLDDKPIYQRQYRIPHSLFNPLRKKLDKFEAAGIIKKADSQWNSPVLAIRKDNGADVRMVLDLRKINSVIQPLPYPLMRIEDILTKLGGSKVFSNLDLNNGYYNIKLAESVKHRFAFTSPWGRYQMERLPQGCITSASVFQQVMNNALHDLIGKGHVFVFQDDVIVHTATVDEHIEVLHELFAALSKINMAVRPSKCQFFKDTIKFLGHIINSKGSRPSEENIKTIRLFERPRTVRQVRSFLGTINFYRKFIKDVTSIAAPLYGLIRKNHTKIEWTDECNKSFILLKEALISAPVLVYPDFTQPFSIKCDASNVGIGGVLEQELDGDIHPIAFCSRKLSRAEQNYSVIEREALAIVYVLNQFRYLIHGYQVVLKTDHKPLSYIFQLKDTNQRLIRWLLLVQDYNLKIEHISGTDNHVADMLSRSDETPDCLSLNAIAKTNYEPITNARVRTAQQADPHCRSLIEKVRANFFKEKEYYLDECDVLLKQVLPARAHSWLYRVVVPTSMQTEVMYNYHDRVFSGHLSLPKVVWKIKQVFTWDTMFRDIANYIQTCENCQRRNTTKIKAPFQSIVPPSFPMERLNIDLLGPFELTKRKKRYLIVYTDSLTRFVIASALPNMEASTVAQDYIEKVFAVHGGSKQILTDRGAQFTGAIFKDLCKRLSISHLMTSSYRPTCNSIAERANQKILRILAHVCNKYYNDWDEKLPFVLYAIRSSPNRSTGESPFYLMHGFDPIDPIVEPSHAYRERHSDVTEFVEHRINDLEVSRAIVADNLSLASEQNCKARNEGRKLKEFFAGQQVLYLDSASYSGKNRKLKPRYKGPYRVVSRLGMVNYRIRNVHDPSETRTTHVDKIKIYYPRLVLDDSDHEAPIKTRGKSSKNEDRCLYDINEDQGNDEIDEEQNFTSHEIDSTNEIDLINLNEELNEIHLPPQNVQGTNDVDPPAHTGEAVFFSYPEENAPVPSVSNPLPCETAPQNEVLLPPNDVSIPTAPSPSHSNAESTGDSTFRQNTRYNLRPNPRRTLKLRDYS